MALNTSLSEPKDGMFLLPKIVFKFYSTEGRLLDVILTMVIENWNRWGFFIEHTSLF